jgi:predicted dehydrogenase
MSETLRAVVIGAGWAGEGHTRALQYLGVDVVAICARRPEVVRAAADRLGVRAASTDWRQTLETVRPDVVALATPAALRTEPIEVAAKLGCHVYSEKPLATNAGEASRLYHLVTQAGIKHALAATHRYDPSVVWMAELLREGAIGRLLEGEFANRLSFSPLRPWSWADTVATGGLFASPLPHVFAILETLTGSPLGAVAGSMRPGRTRAPVVPEVTNYGDVGKLTPTAEEAERLEWRACDVEAGVAALLRFGPSPAGTAEGGATPPTPGEAVTVSFAGSVDAPATWPGSGIRLYGTQGTLVGQGYGSYTVSRIASGRADAQREALSVPQRLVEALPQVGDPLYNKWAALARDFLADIRGEPHQPYLTFRDGWRYQEAIDALRAGKGWHELPSALDTPAGRTAA